jgi:iron(III) transport system substrate-binding protein
VKPPGSPTPPPSKDHWLRDWLTYGSSFWFGRGIVIAVVAVLAGLFLPALTSAKRVLSKPVVVYCAQDQDFAEPLLKQFERESGIKVRAVFDSEAVKTVGLANRLLAERAHPQADVFWGNEELRTRQLAAQGVFRETNGWAAFGYRSRRLVVNTNLVAMGSAPASGAVGRAPRQTSAAAATEARGPVSVTAALADAASAGTRVGARAPQTLLELTNAAWRGKVSLAYPLFGTTATHFLALRQRWGETNWLVWCRALAANKPFLEEGNSGVVKRVGRGEALVGLTDSDDIAGAQREGLPVSGWRSPKEMLLIPNTVAVTRGAPHSAEAQVFFAWLQRPEVVQQLVAAGALEGINSPAAATPQPNWSALLRDLDTATAQLKEIFLR